MFFKRNNIYKFVAALMCVVLFFGNATVFADDIEDAKLKQKELQNSLNQANKVVKELKNSKASTENKLDKLEGEIKALESQSNESEKEIEKINSDIDSLSVQIEETKQTLEQKQSDMNIRIVYSYENGRHKILNALFTSKSMSEFLNILEYCMEIANYDKEVCDEYEQTVQVLSEQTDALAKKQEDAKRLVEENAERQVAITALYNAKNEELGVIEEELTDAKEIAAVYEKEMQAQNEVLSALQAALDAEKQKEAEKNKNENNAGGDNNSSDQSTQPVVPSGNTSGFVWPCPASRRITSEYGPRTSPTAGASTNHKGIDIGAPTGSAILAANSGTVILSQYSASAGNYIIVNHGKNASGKVVCTVYMHASERLVSVGQSVSKGQTIAKVGSTGYSTGPHLHFGVSEDGNYVSPWNYL